MGNTPRLRTGFTTGAATAAAAKGALFHLLHGQGPAAVTITFLTGETARITIEESRLENERTAVCTVIKDAGDDPDVTHGAQIGARVTLLPDNPKQEILISGGKGVGVVTKPGLEVLPGGPAINPGPCRMIRNEVLDLMKYHNLQHALNVEVFVPRGEALAIKTLNARLGIIGGISILGTTGIVRPMSHEAYIATIRSSLSVAGASGAQDVVLTTGRRSERFAQQHWPDKAPLQFIQIGDFFKAGLETAIDLGISDIALAVFFAKAVKMAQGVPHTHAARSAMTLDALAAWALEMTGDKGLSAEIKSANTARHAFDIIVQGHPGVIAGVGERMLDWVGRFSKNRARLVGVIFDYQGVAVFESKRAG